MTHPKIFAVFLFTIASLVTRAQNPNNPTIDLDPDQLQFQKLYPGYIITNEGDTVKGYIEWINREANEHHISFYSDEKKSPPSKIYRPKQIRGYCINGQVYESMVFGPNDGKYKMFILRVLDGGITLYQFYKDTTGLHLNITQVNDTIYVDVIQE